MRDALETFLDVRIRSLQAEPSPYATVFPAAVVSLELDDGSRISVFAKYLGSEESDHPDKQRRDREIRVYEDLFRGRPLPVPSFFGARWNERRRRREVFLEHVDGWNLEYHDVSVWIEAARELGRLHAHFAARRSELLRHDALLRFDRTRLLEVADRADRSVRLAYPELAGRLRSVVADYPQAADLIAEQGVTLVHNDCAPKNVLGAPGERPTRICFVDWELAGVGCGLVDLVHLRHGLDNDAGGAMLAAYSAAVAGTDLLPPEPDRERLVAACELERLLHRLWRSRFWNIGPAAVAAWVADAETLAEQV
jgi:aminoglycoside phosphotransferase (APT) family kinase protein